MTELYKRAKTVIETLFLESLVWLIKGSLLFFLSASLRLRETHQHVWKGRCGDLTCRISASLESSHSSLRPKTVGWIQNRHFPSVTFMKWSVVCGATASRASQGRHPINRTTADWKWESHLQMVFGVTFPFHISSDKSLSRTCRCCLRVFGHVNSP